MIIGDYKGMPGWKALGFNSYEDYLLSSFWQEKRQWILECRGRKCEKCGSTKKINVHHISYWNTGNQHQEDVIVLCEKCHRKEHKIQEDKNGKQKS